MSLKIVTYPNPLLGKPSLPITEVTDEIRKLAEEMTEAMYKSDGIGIAAPQVGRVGETFTGGHPAPGTLVALRDGKLLIACRDALYEVSTLKPAGGKPMPAEAFWNGYCRAANKDGCGRAVSPSLG